MGNKVVIYLILLFATITTSCSANPPKYHPGGPYYYKGWAHYYLPYRPVDEIASSEAAELELQGYAYYIGFFNEQGQIKSFEKRYHGKMEFKVTYYYENGVLNKEESIDASEKTKVILYDEKGNRVNR
jgi:hypothetical protein